MKRVLLILTIGSQVLGCSISAFKSEYAVSAEETLTPSEIMSSIEISTPNIADGITASEIKLVLRSAAGTPVVGEEMTLSMNGLQNVLVPCSKSDKNGLSTCRVYSTHAELKRVIVKGKVTLWKDVTFNSVSPYKRAVGIVSGTTSGTLVGGQKIIAASGR